MLEQNRIFVACRQSDNQVAALHQDGRVTIARDYITELAELFGPHVITAGWQEDKSTLKPGSDFIEPCLQELFEGVKTCLVLITPGMRDNLIPDDSQWLPWELRQAIVSSPRCKIRGLVLPDMKNQYEYVKYDRQDLLPRILKQNIDAGLIPVIQYRKFMRGPDKYLKQSALALKSTPESRVCKQI